MLPRLVIVCALVVAGCGRPMEAKPEPAKAIEVAVKYPRLKPGTKGVVTGAPFVTIQKYGSQPDWRETMGKVKGYQPDFTDDELEKLFPKIAAGDELVVLTDDENGPDEKENRLIYVKVLSGKLTSPVFIGKYLIERRYFTSTPAE